MRANIVIATDLDRTLIPNGLQEPDDGLNILKGILKKYKFRLVFVTGRHQGLFEEAVRKYDLPVPDYVISDVGTKIYRNSSGKFMPVEKWSRLVKQRTKGWDIRMFIRSLREVPALRMQEPDNQNEFKLSYYLSDLGSSDRVVKTVKERILAISPDASVVYSIDETEKVGLLDVLPMCATKVAGLEYVRQALGREKSDMVYCGDSGNDILPLTYGYKSVLVRNAITEVQAQVKSILVKKGLSDLLYIADGHGRLNGYYASGIVEGLVHFGLIDATYND